MTTVRETIWNELTAAIGSISSQGRASAKAIATLSSDREEIVTHKGLSIGTSSGGFRFSTHKHDPDSRSVIGINISSQNGLFTSAPEVVIESPGVVKPEATPKIEGGQIVGSTITKSGGVYADLIELSTIMGDLIQTNRGKTLGINRNELQSQLPFKTSQAFPIGTHESDAFITQDEDVLGARANLFTEGPFIRIPVTVVGSGTGAVVQGLCDARGALVGIRVVEGGSGYDENTTFSFPEPEDAIPPARAKAVLSGNRISHIDVDFGSWGYIVAPRVTITGEGTVGFNETIVKAIRGRCDWRDINEYPTVCVFPSPRYDDVEYVSGRTTLTAMYFQVNILSDKSEGLGQLDRISEDIDILAHRFRDISTVPLILSNAPITLPFDDVFWSRNFSAGTLIVQVIYET